MHMLLYLTLKNVLRKYTMSCYAKSKHRFYYILIKFNIGNYREVILWRFTKIQLQTMYLAIAIKNKITILINEVAILHN